MMRTDAAYQAAGGLWKVRVDAEIAVLAAIAGGPRRAAPILAEVGVTLDHFSEHDTAAIFLAIEWAGRVNRPPRSKAKIAMVARTLLRAVYLWDDDDCRPFVAGCRWGPGPLSALLCRLSFDPALVRRCAEALIRAVAACDAHLRDSNRRRRCA